MNLIFKYSKLFLIIGLIHLILFAGGFWCISTCDGFGCFGCVAFIIPFQYLIPLLAILGLNFYSGVTTQLLSYVLILLIDFLVLYFLVWFYDKKKNRV